MECDFPYPCDVIKVLDSWEAEVHDGSEVSTNREVCDHTDWTRGAYSDGIYVDMGYRYCPKCGETMPPAERTNELVSPAQTDTCDHKKRNICLCDWGDDCPMNSEPDFTYCPKCGEKL